MITRAQSQTLNALPPAPNRYLSDRTLQRLLAGILPPAGLAWLEPILKAMGGEAAERLDELAALADRHRPVLHPRDRFGSRIDAIEFHPAYRELQAASYGAGVVGLYYDPQVRATLGEGCEAAKLAHGYVFSQAEQGLYCPICMTDGAAFLIERYGTDEQKRTYLPRLTSRDLGTLWEGGMHLTEKAGGSDVGANETVARPRPDGRYELFGEKWFCSNASAEVAMVLARPEGAPAGTRGLGLFILRRHRDDGSLNGVRMERLKDKLGTRSMPTGEQTLEGAVAEPLGDLSRGFVQMAQMVNLSRLYNATASMSIVRRCLSDSLRYAQARVAFGEPLIRFGMVRAALVDMAVELEAAMHLVFSTLHRRGRLLYGAPDAANEKLLRLATPLAKYTTAKFAVRAASEAVELHGGNGYIEDWPMARFYRDAQVLPVWEGTTNIQVQDAFRAIRKDKAHEPFLQVIREKGGVDARLVAAARELEEALPARLAGDPTEPANRVWCDRAAQAYQAALLVDAASDARSQAFADAYLLRHFSPQRESLNPPHLEHNETHWRVLLDLE